MAFTNGSHKLLAYRLHALAFRPEDLDNATLTVDDVVLCTDLEKDGGSMTGLDDGTGGSDIRRKR